MSEPKRMNGAEHPMVVFLVGWDLARDIELIEVPYPSTGMPTYRYEATTAMPPLPLRIRPMEAPFPLDSRAGCGDEE